MSDSVLKPISRPFFGHQREQQLECAALTLNKSTTKFHSTVTLTTLIYLLVSCKHYFLLLFAYFYTKQLTSTPKLGVRKTKLLFKYVSYHTKTLITNKCTKRVLSSIVKQSYMFRPCSVIFRENFCCRYTKVALYS
jgi:hypothetical protein